MILPKRQASAQWPVADWVTNYKHARDSRSTNPEVILTQHALGSNHNFSVTYKLCLEKPYRVQEPAGLTPGQVTAVGMLVADMFTEPNAEKRFTLAEVTARAARKGLRFSSDQISEVRDGPEPNAPWR